MNTECEYCGQETREKTREIERPSEAEAKVLAAFVWVIDPHRLVFCDRSCRMRWHHLRRRGMWAEHGAECTCVDCCSRG